MHVTNSGPACTPCSYPAREPETNNREIMVETTASVKSKHNHVPRPRNAFFIFRSVRAREVEAFCHQSEFSKLVAEDWKKMSEEEKECFVKEAALERAEHKKKYPDYKYHPRKRKISNAESELKGKTVTSRKVAHSKRQCSGNNPVSDVRQSDKKSVNVQKASSVAHTRVKPNQVTHKVLSPSGLTDHSTQTPDNNNVAPLRQDLAFRDVSCQTDISLIYSNKGDDNKPKSGVVSFTESEIADFLNPLDESQWLRVLAGESLMEGL
ncbi:HMG-box domain-containing protein [Endozoicomonas acroporae]|uniref:HMG-box domain-containing protein n=2 Tax=Endozoicomonas acroporae TaxID=1701104 RepID=UPI0013D525C2|nr:HMG-box domain-containing protein [Endozoicomonas acroporae]